MMKYITVIGLTILITTQCLASSENLDELAARKSRISTAANPNLVLEDPTTYVWQPETLMYTDAQTGSEVWRITGPNSKNNRLPDLNHSGWSADGKRFVFGSQRDTSAFSNTYEFEYEGVVMMMRADGSFLRPILDGPFKVFVHSRYFNWSPVEPDTYYGFGRNYAKEGLKNSDLYKTIVGDLSATKEKVFELGTVGEASVTKSFSPDGTTLRANGDGKYFFFDMTGATPVLTNPGGWASGRQLDNYWGGVQTPPDANYSNHYSGVVGVGANKKLYIMPEGYNTVWSWELAGGTAPDGGPEHIVDHTPPYDWGTLRPVVTGDSNGGVCGVTRKTPWCCDDDPLTDCDRYFSHNTYDRWGKHMLGVNSQVGDYWATWDLTTHRYVNDKIPTGNHVGWHTDWNAWSDYFATSSSDVPKPGTGPGGVYTSKYDGSVVKRVADVHYKEAGSKDYDAIARATQSPDGTKLIFHSDFLRGVAETWDMFYAVAYFPHPPEITNVSKSGGIYTVRFDWRLGTASPRGYTTRGWPNEATDTPPPPRETKLFRLWRSPNGTDGWVPVNTVEANIFGRYNFQTGGWTGAKYWEISDTPGAGTWHYAVTAQEHSGLESRTLSNVFSTAGTQTAAYPSDPKGDSDFVTVYNPTTVRHYNIYAADGAAPSAVQQDRIASIPVAAAGEYVDWLGDTTGTTQYLITAVDTQGNESGAIAGATRTVLAAPGQYKVAWDVGETPGEPANPPGQARRLSLGGSLLKIVEPGP